eukprot:6198208-Pleurochrysis_carterae.AAC.4
MSRAFRCRGVSFLHSASVAPNFRPVRNTHTCLTNASALEVGFLARTQLAARATFELRGLCTRTGQRRANRAVHTTLRMPVCVRPCAREVPVRVRVVIWSCVRVRSCSQARACPCACSVQAELGLEISEAAAKVRRDGR